MRKTTRRNRILAFILTFAMIFQQAGITTFADEGTSAAAGTTVEATMNDTDETTAAEEVSSADETNAQTSAAESSAATSEETTAQTTVSTEAEEVSATDTEASADPADTDETDAEASDHDTDPAAETIVDAEDESEADTESAAEDVTEAESEEVTEAATDAEEDTEAAESLDETDETEAATEDEDEETVPKTSFTYSDEKVVITATAGEEANFPQDAELVAKYIEPGSTAYNEAVSKIESQLGSSLGITDEDTETAYVVYDVYFLSNGEEIEPEAGTVSVSMVFRSAVNTGITGEITSKAVVHIKDSGTAEVVTDFLNVNENGDVTAMGFTQDSFSEVMGVLGATNGTPVDLEDITSSITVNVTSGTTDIDRGATLSISVAYSIDDSKITEAKNATVWVYDLNDYLTGENAIFSSLAESGSGYIMSGSTEAGTYSIVDGVIYLYVYPSWIANKNENISGTFSFTATLDETKVGTNSSTEIVFPGTSVPVKITYEDVTASSSKSISGYDNGGTAYLTEDSNGNYTLSYSADVKTNAVLSELTFNDEMSTDQTLNTDSVTVSVSGGSTYSIPFSSGYITYDSTTGKFSVDVSGYLATQGLTITKDTTYTIAYSVIIDSTKVETDNTTVKNKSSWNWGGTNSTEPSETTVLYH